LFSTSFVNIGSQVEKKPYSEPGLREGKKHVLAQLLDPEESTWGTETEILQKTLQWGKHPIKFTPKIYAKINQLQLKTRLHYFQCSEKSLFSPWILLHLLPPCHTGASREEHTTYQLRTMKLFNGGQLYFTSIPYIYVIS